MTFTEEQLHWIKFKLNMLDLKYEQRDDGSSFSPGAWRAINDVRELMGLQRKDAEFI